MKFKTTAKNLLNSLQILSGIVERKQTLPILSHVLLTLKEGVLSLTGSDLEIELSMSITVEQFTEGSATVSAHKIFDICRSFNDDDEISFKMVDATKLVVSSGKSKFSLSTLTPDNFPKITTTESIQNFQIKQNSLLKLFKNVSFSMATQDVRYYLNGLLLEIKDKKINVVATDGHRLAMDNDDIECESNQELQIIIPRKAVLEITKILTETDAVVNIEVTDNQLILNNDTTTLIVRLIDGRYPDYNKVIPKDGNKEIVFNKELFSHSLRRASILSNEKYHGVKLIFANNIVNIHTDNSDKEQAQDEIKVDYQHDELEIGFNVSYLLDAINAVHSSEIKMVVKDDNDSCLVKYNNKDYPVFVIMPMRL